MWVSRSLQGFLIGRGIEGKGMKTSIEIAVRSLDFTTLFTLRRRRVRGLIRAINRWHCLRFRRVAAG